MKFTTIEQEKEKPVVLSFVEESDGAVVVRADRGSVKAEVLRFSSQGCVYRIIGNTSPLKELGFEVENGMVALK